MPRVEVLSELQGRDDEVMLSERVPAELFANVRARVPMSPGYEAGSDDEMPISARNSSATVGASVGR